MTERQDLPNQWVIVLDEYEAVNLGAILTDINERSSRYNTGDWINQIRWKLPHSIQGMRPNTLWGEVERPGWMSNDNQEQVQAVVDAWNVEGPQPFIHRKAKKRLKEDWPYLHTAISELANLDLTTDIDIKPFTTPPVSVTTVGLADPQDRRLAEPWLHWKYRLWRDKE